MVALDSTAFIQEIERRLDNSFAVGESISNGGGGAVLREAARHLCLADGAKRSRPRLVLLFGKAVGADPQAMVDIGVSGELIHAASLLHDDVVDEGETRRGRPTVNAVWGNLAAVLTGDLVLARAIRMLMPWPDQVTEGALTVVVEMSEGAIIEADHRGRAVDIATWMAIAEGKTGALLGWCGEAVALTAGDHEAAKRFRSCGRHLGIAYQLADDIWDFEGLKGKDPLQDLTHGNPSYVIAAATDASPGLRADIEAFWAGGSKAPIAPLVEAVRDAGGIERASLLLQEEIAAAVAAMGPWANRDGGEKIAEWATMLATSFGGAP